VAQSMIGAVALHACTLRAQRYHYLKRKLG
jgi:hypothetical protein